MSISAKCMIESWLRAHPEYDGLATEDCGCSVDDLAPCDDLDDCVLTCVAAHSVKCPGGEDCFCGGEHDPETVGWVAGPRPAYVREGE